MVKRIKKPAITPEVRLDWLRRYEEDRESPPLIAEKDSVDVRTVRRHIALAREQRETREARAIVLRNALDSHYQDMLRLAETLEDEALGVGHGPAIKDAEFLEVALRQHLLRSPIWPALSKLKKLRQEKLEQTNNIESAVNKAAESKSEINALIQAGLKGIAMASSLLMIQQVNFWLQGSPVQDLKGRLFTKDPVERGQAGLRLSGSFIGRVREEEVKKVEKVIEDFVEGLQRHLRESNEYYDMEKTTSEIKRTQQKLHEELAIIRLRHVVPGRCKFCPPW